MARCRRLVTRGVLPQLEVLPPSSGNMAPPIAADRRQSRDVRNHRILTVVGRALAGAEMGQIGLLEGAYPGGRFGGWALFQRQPLLSVGVTRRASAHRTIPSIPLNALTHFDRPASKHITAFVIAMRS